MNKILMVSAVALLVGLSPAGAKVTGYSAPRAPTPTYHAPTPAYHAPAITPTPAAPAARAPVSGGYGSGKPATTQAPTAAQPSVHTQSSPAPAVPAARSNAPTPATGSTAAVNRAASKSALSDYQNKFKPVSTPPAPPPRGITVVNHYHTYNDYTVARGRYYGGYVMPSYSYGFHPYYGAWDTMFLFYMLSSINNQQNAAFFYNHQADLAQWQQEVQQQAATNAELQGQLNALNQQIATMKQNNVPVDPNYLPPNTPADMALAPGNIPIDDLQNSSNEEPTPIQTPSPPPTDQHEGDSHLFLYFLVGGVVIGGGALILSRRS